MENYIDGPGILWDIIVSNGDVPFFVVAVEGVVTDLVLVVVLFNHQILIILICRALDSSF
jgi:hypothetical protein